VRVKAAGLEAVNPARRTTPDLKARVGAAGLFDTRTPTAPSPEISQWNSNWFMRSRVLPPWRRWGRPPLLLHQRPPVPMRHALRYARRRATDSVL